MSHLPAFLLYNQSCEALLLRRASHGADICASHISPWPEEQCGAVTLLFGPFCRRESTGRVQQRTRARHPARVQGQSLWDCPSTPGMQIAPGKCRRKPPDCVLIYTCSQKRMQEKYPALPRFSAQSPVPVCFKHELT